MQQQHGGSLAQHRHRRLQARCARGRDWALPPLHRAGQRPGLGVDQGAGGSLHQRLRGRHQRIGGGRIGAWGRQLGQAAQGQRTSAVVLTKAAIRSVGWTGNGSRCRSDPS